MRSRCPAALRAGALCAALVTPALGASAEDLTVVVGYLRHREAPPPTLSNLDPTPQDIGLAGARLGLADNAKTGRFLGHGYELIEADAAPEDDALAAAGEMLAAADLIVVDAPADTLTAIADLPAAAGALIFNAGAEDTALRGAGCRANILHTAPSLAMRTDALAEFMLSRKWTRWALIAGAHPEDAAFAAAMTRSGEKFGLKLIGEKAWVFDADMRRNASREVPLFTQGFDEHDLLVVADEIGDFGRYIAYNTWVPRPIAGSEGLTPVAWSRVVEQWGAAQLQSRFEEMAGRPMESRDYAAWAAVRAIGEAVTRTGAAEAGALRAYMLGDAFDLAGFKGRKLTFRRWNGQLRQPIPLVTPRAVVAQAPLPGFLHRRNEMDTLGLDEPESACAAFEEPR